MSVILITSHDENITKITQKAQERPNDSKNWSVVTFKTKRKERMKLGAMKVSPGKAGPAKFTPVKFSPFLTNVIKKPCATMGVPQEAPPDPCNYLKKHTGKMCYNLNTRIEDLAEKGKSKLDRVPTRKECLEEYYKRKKEEDELKKNFVVKNIKEVLKMKPKEPEQRVVLEPHGETKRLIDGLEPIYIKTSAFGKTPAYLQTLIKKTEKLHQMQKELKGVEKTKCRYIRKHEREQLLEGLKHNWEELQKQYQGLPILTDTIPKIIRKSKLEAELKQLEKDIVLIERHPYIYMYDEQDFI